MTRIDLMIYSGVMKEYRPMNWRRRKAYSRRIDHALRHVCPPDNPFGALLEAMGSILLVLLAIGMPAGFVVMFVRWWMGA